MKVQLCHIARREKDQTKKHPGPPGWALSAGLITLPCKTLHATPGNWRIHHPTPGNPGYPTYLLSQYEIGFRSCWFLVYGWIPVNLNL